VSLSYAMSTTDKLTLDASDPRFYAESNREAYLRIHAEHPIYWVQAAFAKPFWNVCSHELIREVSRDVELFTTQYGVHLENNAFEVVGAEGLVGALRPANLLPPDEHRRVRGPLNPHFRHDEIAKLESDVRSIIIGLLDEVERGTEVDFMTAFGRRVPLQVTAKLLGVGIEREADFQGWSDAVLASFEVGSLPDWEAIGALAQFFTGEIATRKAEPAPGLISDMLASDLPEHEVLMWCCILLAAGIETTGNLIGAGMDVLLRHRDQLERVIADPSLTRQTVSELLRVVTPGRYIRRTATADTVLGGEAIREGDVVAMNFTAANYDPHLFPDPLRFDIERAPNEALAFGSGPHRCIGMFLARLESVIAFEELLARFPHTEARGPAVFRPTIATTVVESLPVVFAAVS
jgi:cholest-4-en-3-one 26-monooxygenase